MFGHSVFDPVSPQGLAISTLLIVLIIISFFIVALILGVLIYTSIRFRQRPGQGDPPQTFGIAKLEIAWTVIPFLLLVVVFGAAVKSMQASSPPNDSSLQGHQRLGMTVIGHQWWWEVRYPSGVVTANEIHLPLHVRMLVALRSVDVIHSLWLPQLNGKMDLVPGQTNYMWLQADKAGAYVGACAEYCGAGHARMLVRVIAQATPQFVVWQRRQLQAPAKPAPGMAARGAALFQQLTCQSCHVAAAIGPNLQHFASRQTLAAGTLTNTPAHVAAWLRDPQAVKPGNHMPSLQLSATQIHALTAYLESLR